MNEGPTSPEPYRVPAGAAFTANQPLASQPTRARAHDAIDSLWQPSFTAQDPQTLIGRGHAYELVAEELGLPEPQVHLSVATEEVAARIPEAVERVRDRLAMRSRAEIIRDWRARGEEIRQAAKNLRPEA